jgi:uncharacterized membrane protein YccC
MPNNPEAARSRGRAMMVVGLIGVLAAVIWLLVITDPFPMWLIIAGGGLVFVGAGAALNRTGR